LFGTATGRCNVNEKQMGGAEEKIRTEKEVTVNWSKLHNE
jgi:hypothetical protein